jgi:hypothetical protein
MAKLTPYYGTPRLDGQHPDVFPGSPLALIAVFVETIRLRFSQDNANRIPYYWTQDPTPTSEEEHTVDHPRKILIESQYLQNPDSRDFRPAILVDRGDMAFAKIAVGNRAEYDEKTDSNLYVMHATTPISVMCVAKDRGESMSIGEIVAFYLASILPEMRETFGFQDASLPVLSSTQVYRRSSNDIEEWITPVNLQVTCKHIWKEAVIAPKLREIQFSLGLATPDGAVTINQYGLYKGLKPQ